MRFLLLFNWACWLLIGCISKKENNETINKTDTDSLYSLSTRRNMSSNEYLEYIKKRDSSILEEVKPDSVFSYFFNILDGSLINHKEPSFIYNECLDIEICHTVWLTFISTDP